MKPLLSISAVAALMLFVGTPAHGDHHNEGVQRVGAWFDAHECAICKHLGEKPELMQAMRWETHLLKNGMMMVAVAPEELRAEYAACCKSMKNASEEIADGAEAESICGYCDSFTELVHDGAVLQELVTAVGSVTLVTSDNPSMVEKIHVHAKRTQEEEAKLLATMLAESSDD